MPTGDRQLVGMLQQAIEESDFAWSLCLIGEDQSHKLAALTGDLRGKPSNTGDGKQISSGFAYWGIAPTIAWAHACNDPFYPVMQQSIESFSQRWILFSLLGNTLANFEHDLAVLGKLTGLFRPQDRFLLEVATTEALGEEQAAGADDEYPQRGSGGGASGRGCGGLAPTKHSRAYQEFVTSALRVKVIYQNQTGGDIRLMLPDRTRVAFPDRDTIRLYLSRTYARHELDGMLDAVGMRKLHGTHFGFASHLSAGHGFGMDLLLFAAGPPGSASRQRASRADEIWSSAQP